MTQKIYIIGIIGIVVISTGVFYGGMEYGQSKISNNFKQGNQRFQQIGQIEDVSRNSAGFTIGEVIAKDDNSITIKLRDGGSKIIFYSNSTEISKFVSGTVQELQIGQSINITGTANQDGSLTATMIQIRPEQLK